VAFPISLDALSEDESVTGGAFGDVAVPQRVKTSVTQPPEVGVGIRVVPEHGRAHRVLNTGPAPIGDDGQQVAARREPPRHPRDETALVLHHERLYRLDKLSDLVGDYGLPHDQPGDQYTGYEQRPFEMYIEVQLWSDEPMRGYLVGDT
jgi:hypothetical protein